MTDKVDPRAVPVGPRTRRARRLFWGLMAAGAVGGVVLGIVSGDGPSVLDGGTMPATTAIILAVGYLAAMIASLVWLRNVDEIEAGAYNFGGLLAIHAYFVALPLWWLGWKGSLLPAPDQFVILAAVTLAWCAGWLWRRYR